MTSCQLNGAAAKKQDSNPYDIIQHQTTEIIRAIQAKKYKKARNLIAKSSHQAINNALSQGSTPLSVAIEENDDRMVRFLLAHGAEASEHTLYQAVFAYLNVPGDSFDRSERIARAHNIVALLLERGIYINNEIKNYLGVLEMEPSDRVRQEELLRVQELLNKYEYHRPPLAAPWG